MADTVTKIITLTNLTEFKTKADALYAKKTDIPSAITVDSALSSTSTNPVQNKIINTALAGKQASLTTAQLAAANSGVTSSKVTSYDAVVTNLGSTSVYATNTEVDALFA